MDGDGTSVANREWATTTGTQTDGGTWTSSGTSVTFTSATDGSLAYAGTYSDNTLTLDNGDRTAQVFTRQ